MVGLSRSIQLSLHIHTSPAAMAESAVRIMAKSCEKALAKRGVFNIALSGGATPLPFYRLLSQPEWAERFPWEKINIYFVDERAVEPEDPDSNFGMIRRELLVHVPATHYFRIKAENDPVAAAQDYEAIIREDFGLKEGEVPRFDFILLGMGTNGHTGSISKGSPAALPEQRRLVVDQYVPGRRYDRVTLTLPVLNNARCCMFLVTGREKHDVLARALDLLAEPELPAQMVRPRGKLIWIVDEAAATGQEPGQ